MKKTKNQSSQQVESKTDEDLKEEALLGLEAGVPWNGD